jgi:hypothetical protein
MTHTELVCFRVVVGDKLLIKGVSQLPEPSFAFEEFL